MDRFLAGVERRAFRMAHLATRDREEALDVVQDAMFKLVQRYGNRGASEWGPLFYRILQNRIQDWHRRHWIRTRWRVWLGTPLDQEDRVLDENPIESLPDTQSPTPIDHMANKEARTALEEALQNLPMRQRQAFLLRTWEGFDVAQTAQAMGCSEGSVKTHYFRAIHTLRNALADYRL